MEFRSKDKLHDAAVVHFVQRDIAGRTWSPRNKVGLSLVFTCVPCACSTLEVPQLRGVVHGDDVRWCHRLIGVGDFMLYF